MTVFLNGAFVPENQAMVSVFDRGFLYGDGLFETLLVWNGKPFGWAEHLARLERGAEFLRIGLPFTAAQLSEFARELIAREGVQTGILRLSVSRGCGPRGYSPKSAGPPTFVMTLHPVEAATVLNPPPWRLATASFRLCAGEALAAYKTANKLAQVLARAEAESAGADEALLLNSDGHAAEAATGNLFWVEGIGVGTPPLAGGALAGVTRAMLIGLCHELGFVVREREITPAELKARDAVFVTLSTFGLVEVEAIDDRQLRRSALTARLRDAYWRRVHSETA